MAQADDQIVAVLELAMDEAERKFEAFKKRVETPLRITLSESQPGGTTGTARTFDGRSVVTGPANYREPTISVPQRGPSLQEQFQTAHVQRTAPNIGGTGISPATLPAPTASTNTVYGNVGRAALPVGGFGTVSPLGSPPPAPPAAGFLPPGTWFEMMGPANRLSWNNVRVPYTMPGIESRGRVTPPPRAAADPFDAFVDNEVLGSMTPMVMPSGMRTARVGSLTTMNPRQPGIARRMAGGFFAGAGPGGVATASLGIAFTATQVIQEWAGQYTAERDAGLLDTLTQQARQQANAARQTTGPQRWAGEWGNWLGVNRLVARNFEFTTDATVAETEQMARRLERGDEARVNRRQNAAIDREVASLGERGISARVAGIRNAAANEDADLAAQIRTLSNQGLDVSDLTRRRSALDRRARYAEREAFADYGWQMRYNAAAIPGMRERAMGREYAGGMADISAAEFKERSEFDRAAGLLFPGDRQRGQDAISERFNAQRSVLQNQYARDSEATAFSLTSNTNATRLRNLGRPLDAQLMEIRDDRIGRIRAIDRSAPGAGGMIAAIDANTAAQSGAARRQFGFDQAQVQSSLASDSDVLNAALARNPVGARAYGIAGQGRLEVRSLGFRGMLQEASLAKSNNLRRLDALQQEYQDSFEGRQFDLANNLIPGKQMGSISAVYDAFGKARQQVLETSTDADSYLSGGKEMADAVRQIPQSIRDGIRDAVAR